MIHNRDSIVIMIQLFFHQYVITTQVEKKVENFLSVRFFPDSRFQMINHKSENIWYRDYVQINGERTFGPQAI